MLAMLQVWSRLRIIFLGIGLIGLVLVISDFAGWIPGTRDAVPRDVVVPRATVLEDSSSVAATPGPPTDGSLEEAVATPLPSPIPTLTPQVHTVMADESLLQIATTYGVRAELIIRANDLWDPNRLREGQPLLIPAPAYVAQPIQGKPGELRLWWPLQGEITTYFGEREAYYLGGTHTGIDLAADVGVPVRAAAAGKVVLAWKRPDNLGWHIIVDHGNGLSTLYGHLSQFMVDEGDSVERGEVIGAVGDTGFSFGPHLHFEVRRLGTPQDPLQYLP